jgi:tRNA/tmRNA/rRNA uracil-C5-methylase (TrmA/RlmC/RlmD family)
VKAEGEVGDPGSIRVSIEKLATTGEGITRGPLGTGFVAGALPGEDVEAEIQEVHKKIWKGRVKSVIATSPERHSGPHAGCAGCDWGYFEVEAARRAKRALFLETMQKLAWLQSDRFGELPLIPSPTGYRLRVRFHVSGMGRDVALGYHVPRSHRVESAAHCEALSQEMRATLPRLRERLAFCPVAVSEISVTEDLDGRRRIAQARVAVGENRENAQALGEILRDVFEGWTIVGEDGAHLASAGPQLLWVSLDGRDYPMTPSSFFQVNRHLVGPLALHVAEAAAAPPGRALDAFGGVGLFAGALLERGFQVTSVESSRSASDLAVQARRRWNVRDDSWTIVHATIQSWIRSGGEGFDVAVLDPPRAGLGKELVAALADRVRARIIYVSCEPATLARDLAAFERRGFHVTSARLFDFFAFTHRVEAVVSLEPLRLK